MKKINRKFHSTFLSVRIITSAILFVLLTPILTLKPIHVQAQAQTSQAANALRAALHSSAIGISNRAHQQLSQHIPDGQAFVWVDIEWNIEAIQAAIGSSLDEGGDAQSPSVALPYELRTSTWSMRRLDEVVKDNAQPYIRRLAVTLYLDSELPEQAEALARKILTHVLPFNESRGDTLSIEREDLARFDLKKQIEATNELVEQLQRESMSLQQAVNQERLEKESYSNLIQNLENAETTIKGQLESESQLRKTVEEELTSLKKELEELNSLPVFLQVLRKYSRGLEVPFAALICVVIVCMARFVWLLMEAGVKNRMTAKIARSIDQVAESLKESAQAAAKGAQSSGKKETEKSATRIKSQDQNAQGATLFPALPPEQVQLLNGQAKVLWQELIGWKFPTIVVLKEWLAQEQNVRVAKVLTALGPDDQAKLIASFSANEATEVIQSLVQSPLAGEAATISAQLYQEVQLYIQSRPPWVGSLHQPAFLKIQLDSLARICSKQEPEIIAFVLFLILPKSAGLLLEQLPESLAERALQAMPIIATISEGEAKRRLEVINAAADAVASSERSAVAAQSIALYESVRENLRSAITSGLSEQADVLNYVLQNVISIEKIFSLDQDTLSEILEPFAPEDLAVLLTGLSPEYVEKVRPTMSRTAFITLQSEMSRISSRPSMLRKASNNALRLQRELLRRVKSMQREGELSFEDTGTGEEAMPAMRQTA